MTATIPDLWPKDIRADLVTPYAILRAQASLLERRTQGTLQAKLSTVTSNGWMHHQLDVTAPALDYYRTTVLAAKHQQDVPYPVTVVSEAFVPKRKGVTSVPAPPEPPVPVPMRAPAPPTNEREAATQEDFIKLVRDVLQSEHVRAIIQSLIARSNEFQESIKHAEPASPGPVSGEKTESR